jgi:hypothetical protein
MSSRYPCPAAAIRKSYRKLPRLVGLAEPGSDFLRTEAAFLRQFLQRLKLIRRMHVLARAFSSRLIS